ncbi:MAG: CopG family ribbon-helix-helix protein [Candidatus Methylarchaceae archaeon HK01B]|nr:CopG family ribbon-helix-helix protein [Candidatus Methylarchaceae archaeon HK01B]
MTIISLSLKEDFLKEADRIQKELGFSGRSELIRAGLRMIIADSKEKEKLVGRINSILLVVHNQKYEDIVIEIMHEFEDIINTQIHSHLKERNCLEVFILDGDAVKVKRLVRLFRTSGKMDYVKLIVV